MAGAYLDDLQADQHASLDVERLHRFAEGSRPQEVHNLFGNNVSSQRCIRLTLGGGVDYVKN